MRILLHYNYPINKKILLYYQSFCAKYGPAVSAPRSVGGDGGITNTAGAAVGDLKRTKKKWCAICPCSIQNLKFTLWVKDLKELINYYELIANR